MFNTRLIVMNKAIVGLLVALMIIFSNTPSASAAWWTQNSQGECSNLVPKGASWINWSGYNFWDWGFTKAELHWWNGSSWILKATGNKQVYGGTGNASVSLSTTYTRGSWVQAGAHGASFISGQVNSNQQFVCP